MVRFVKIAFFAWTSCIVQPVVAQTSTAATPSIRPGIPYAEARPRLLAAGYKPFRVLAPGSDAYRMHVFNRNDIYLRYPEVESCAGTKEADCSFILTRGAGDFLVVHTIGEEARSIVVRDVRRITNIQANAFYR